MWGVWCWFVVVDVGIVSDSWVGFEVVIFDFVWGDEFVGIVGVVVCGGYVKSGCYIGVVVDWVVVVNVVGGYWEGLWEMREWDGGVDGIGVVVCFGYGWCKL